MINKIIEQLQNEIQHSRYPEDVEEAKEKLQNIIRLWKKFGKDPLALKMQDVVKKVVEAYHMDFYLHDLSFLEKIGDSKFCWFVRNHGTHFIPLEGDEDRIREAECELHAVRQVFTDGINVKDTQRLYICDPKTNTMKRLKTFSGIQFRVTTLA